jgi:hypothetical protein
MKISDRIKGLFRWRWEPPTAEELAARAEAESLREQFDRDKAVRKSELESRQGMFPPP